MTPKGTAKSLLEKFMKEIGEFTGGQERHAPLFAKRLAIISVKETWNALDKNFHVKDGQHALIEMKWLNLKQYWKDVEAEILKS